MLTFEKMRPEERDTCAALAARAFEDYEYFTYYIPNEQRRTRFLSTMLEIEVRINDGFLYGQGGSKNFGCSHAVPARIQKAF